MSVLFTLENFKMKISKREALLLVKVFNQLRDHLQNSSSELKDFQHRVDSFLCGEDDELNEDNSTVDVDVEFEDEPDNDDLVEQHVDSRLKHTKYVDAKHLHDLFCASTTAGSIEFELIEQVNDVKVNLLNDGVTAVVDVIYVRRFGKELHVGDAKGNWHFYHIKRYPGGWAFTLPLDQLVKVLA